MLREGMQISHYRLLRKVGGGGMGDVYLAEHMHLNTQVAIKVIKPSIISDSNAMRLFLREARAIAALDHPNILPLFDYGEITLDENVYPYIVMPLRQEGSLKTWLKQQNSLSLRSIVEIVSQAASALQHAHDRQIIHLDVKPSNFLLRYTSVHPEFPDLLLTDFGLAKIMNVDISVTRTSRGTPLYMASEQWKGHPVAASDQYSLAVMTYEMLTGRTPFVGNSPEQLMYQHINVEPEPPGTFNSQVTPEIDRVVLRALSKRPEDRFARVSDFADAFRQAVFPNSSTPTPPPNVLRTTLVITQDEAMVGTSRSLSFPGLPRVDVNIPSGIRDGQIIRLRVQDKTSNSNSSSTIDTLIVTVAITSDIEIEHSSPSPLSPRTFLFAGLALLVVLSSLGLFTILRNHQQAIDQENTAAVARVSLTSTAHTSVKATASAAANATATIQVSVATAAAGTDATATAVAQAATATATAQQNIYIQATKGTPVLNDPLVNNQPGYGWSEISLAGQEGTCVFTNNAYHVTETKINRFYRCEALQTDFSNFAYQVEATIQQGDETGIVFRFDKALSTFYAFHINTDGAYNLDVDNSSGFIRSLGQGYSSAIQIGRNRTSLITVIARGPNLYLFVNKQFVTSAIDSTYKNGAIGVMAVDDGDTTSVYFTNAEVWKL